MQIWHGTPRLSHCTFLENVANRGGGAIYYVTNDPQPVDSVELDHCDFIGNRADKFGGAVFFRSGKLIARNCRFIGNSAERGGALYDLSSRSSYYINNVFDGNSCSLQASAVYSDSFDFYLLQCNVTGNVSSSALKHAIELRNDRSTLRNCIVWDNDGSGYPVSFDDATPDIAFSILQGLANTTPDLDGNFAADPLFVDPVNRDFRLSPLSPAINRGDTDVVVSPPYPMVSGVIVDLAGNPRVNSNLVDLGAYEFQNSVPIAVLDTYSTLQNTSLEVAAPGVLENDSDPDGDSLTVEVKKSPQFGSLVLNPDGSFLYVPEENFAGSDSFTYTLSDFAGRSSGQVKITVRAVIQREDLDANRCVDRVDLDLLVQAIRLRSRDSRYDLNQDGQVNIADARWLVLRFTNAGGVPCSDND